MVQRRVKGLRSEIREFYRTEVCREWAKTFLEEDFNTYDDAPNVLHWILNNPIEGKSPQFLLQAVGAGLIEGPLAFHHDIGHLTPQPVSS